jgi:hypothetical protein
VKIGLLTDRDDDAALERVIAALCRRGYAALVAEREAANAAPPRPVANKADAQGLYLP